MPSSSWDAAGESSVMLLPVCLRQDGVAAPGIAQALPKGARLLETWDLLGSSAWPWSRGVPRLRDSSDGPGLAQSAALFHFRWKCFDFSLAEKMLEIPNVHFIFQLELDVPQKGNSLSLPGCSLEEGAFEEMHKRGVAWSSEEKMGVRIRGCSSSAQIEVYFLIWTFRVLANKNTVYASFLPNTWNFSKGYLYQPGLVTGLQNRSGRQGWGRESKVF